MEIETETHTGHRKQKVMTPSYSVHGAWLLTKINLSDFVADIKSEK